MDFDFKNYKVPMIIFRPEGLFQFKLDKSRLLGRKKFVRVLKCVYFCPPSNKWKINK